LNQFFKLNDTYQTVFLAQDVVAFTTFIVHQVKLSKKLTTVTCMQDHLNDVRKLSSLNVQKLLLKEVITANEIAKDILDVY
jgi:hypothetical protein